ncbi:hypothetical protein [Nostoc sp.]|uniref:hypothetical protein n=1 Tax=Nostoc sp. TaxID=1180 RepID=UPI002FEF5E00
MKPNSSVSVNSAFTEKSASNCKHGITSTNSTFPILGSNFVSSQSTYTAKLNPAPTVGSTSPQNYSMPPSKSSSVTPSITTNSQASEAKCIPINKEVDRNSSKWQYLPIILKFIGEQLTSQLPLVFSGAIGLVVVAMLIGQASGGIKLKLDLEVSPAPNQSEKALTTK